MRRQLSGFDIVSEAATMTALQIFLLGLMVGWTPGVLLLAWMIYRTPLAANDSPELHADQDTATLVPTAVSAELPPAESAANGDNSTRRVCKTA